MAGIRGFCSNYSEGTFTPDQLRKLTVSGNRGEEPSEPASYQPQELSKRLGAVKVREVVHRAKAGESATSLAVELGVAPSALIRMLREQGVTVQRRKVSDELATSMAREYEAGATMAELEKKYGLSHGAIYRALHRAGVEMRTGAPRRKSE